MQTKHAATMTQEELVKDLHLLGYQEISECRVARWRKRGVLPTFTNTGSGQGRGGGREKAYWSNPEEVLKQAEAIIQLLKHFRRLDELYVPLWELGYSVPLNSLRS